MLGLGSLFNSQMKKVKERDWEDKKRKQVKQGKEKFPKVTKNVFKHQKVNKKLHEEYMKLHEEYMILNGISCKFPKSKFVIGLIHRKLCVCVCMCVCVCVCVYATQ